MSAVAPAAVASEPKGGFPSDVVAIADRFRVQHLLPRLYGEIGQLVQEPIEVRVEWDPEIEDCPKIAFIGRSSLRWEQCLERERTWIERLLKLAGPDALVFGLTIYPAS